MMEHPLTRSGRLLKGGRIVLDGTAVTVADPGATRWSGTLVLPPGQFLAGGLYVLQLEDGRSGDVFLASTATGREPETVTFRGGKGPA
jgi:hypothetical protein